MLQGDSEFIFPGSGSKVQTMQQRRSDGDSTTMTEVSGQCNRRYRVSWSREEVERVVSAFLSLLCSFCLSLPWSSALALWLTRTLIYSVTLFDQDELDTFLMDFAFKKGGWK